MSSSTLICMIVNASPDPSMYHSTIQVLKNSAVASDVRAHFQFSSFSMTLKEINESDAIQIV